MSETTSAAGSEENAGAMRRAGDQLSQLGGQIYSLADRYPEIEETEDFNQMMFFLNKLSYRLIHGHERDE